MKEIIAYWVSIHDRYCEKHFNILFQHTCWVPNRKVNFSTQAFSTFFKDAPKNTQPPRYSPISLPSGIHTLCNTISHCTRVGLVISRWQGKWWYVTSKFKLWKTSVSILDILSLALFFSFLYHLLWGKLLSTLWAILWRGPLPRNWGRSIANSEKETETQSNRPLKTRPAHTCMNELRSWSFICRWALRWLPLKMTGSLTATSWETPMYVLT